MPFLFTRNFIVLVLLSCSLVGCNSGAKLSELPLVPEIDTSRYSPAIQEQLNTALEEVNEFPGKADINGQLGRLLYTYEQYKSAAVLFDRASALRPKEFEWPYLSGRARAELGQTEAAEAKLKQALELNPKYAPIYVHLAELYLKASRDIEAREAVKRVLLLEPERPEAHFILAKLAARGGEPEEAIGHLERVEKLSGQFAALHYQYSQMYRQLGEHEKADAYLARYEQHRDVTANVVDPVLGNVHDLNMSVNQLVSRAKRLVGQGRQAQALELLEKAVTNNPDSLAAHVTLVGVYSSNRRFAEADRHIAAAAAIDPDHPKLQYAIGVARLIEERKTEAAMAFERSLRINPRNADALVQLGMLFEQQDRNREAELKFEAALAQSPVHRMAHWRLGRMKLNQDNATAALEHLEKIYELVDPATPEILIDLAKAYAGVERTNDAVSALEKSIELSSRFDNYRASNQATMLLNKYQKQSDRDN